MKVLYANHTAVMSGAEQSLLDLIESSSVVVDASLACPDGELAEAARARSIPVRLVHPVKLSTRLEPVALIDGLQSAYRFGRQVTRIASKEAFDVIHGNSLRTGIAIQLSQYPRKRWSEPLIVHARDVAPEGKVGRAMRRVLDTSGITIVANSRYTARSLGHFRKAAVAVAHNGIDPARFQFDAQRRTQIRNEFGIEANAVLLGVIGQITPWKGQDHAIRVLARLRDQYPGSRLLLVGTVKFDTRSTKFDNSTFLQSLKSLSESLGVEDAVVYTGQRSDIPAFLSALDVLLIPSWVEPFGRTVLEGMAVGTPVVATAIGGPAEVITDRQNGLLRDPYDVEAWTDAVASLLADGGVRDLLVARAHETVSTRFTLETHVAKVLRVYLGLQRPDPGHG